MYDERPIDRHEPARPGNEALKKERMIQAVNNINRWRDAWTACSQFMQHERFDLRGFHRVFERWVPLLNRIFGSPIPNLHQYEPCFYYSTEAVGPKEILQLYFEEGEEKTCVHIIFNLHDFQALHRGYCSNMSRSNSLLCNESKGTIVLSCPYDGRPADYFKIMIAWQMLFIHTMHALAHWDTYAAYHHAHYDTHQYMKESPFFKISLYGRIENRK